MKICRNTIQRNLVLSAVRALPQHPTAEEIYQAILIDYPAISRATVYRNLNLLAQNSEIRRVQVADGADRFDYDCRPHYHIRCRRCGRVFDRQIPYQPQLSGSLSDDGFVVESHDIVFAGICPACNK